MNNYFRITAYHPTENISAVLDSFGKFDKLWKFSSFLITKGFKIIEVSADDKFLVQRNSSSLTTKKILTV